MTCGGYGLQKCYLCKGRGIVVWEGKLQHSDPCPMCFGTCHVKVYRYFSSGIDIRFSFSFSKGSKFVYIYIWN